MARRRLQNEMENVFKKVDEGVVLFEEIWDKVHSTTNQAQKEKQEADLKKEIKKLQRLRDNIKTWQGDNAIKDKTKLDKYRRIIESKMEDFKVCERETKTKAFSRQGLARDLVDPKEEAREAADTWVGDVILKLEEGLETLEAEIEKLRSGKRKKRGEENPEVTERKERIERHKHHISMLEVVLRALHNSKVTPEEVFGLQESVDYYVENSNEPDFYEDEEMYDGLDLEATPTPSPNQKPSERKVIRDSNEGSECSGGATSSSKKITIPRRISSTAATGKAGGKPATANRAASPKHVRFVAGSLQNNPGTPSPSSAASGKDPTPYQSTNAPLLSSVVKGSNSKIHNSAGKDQNGNDLQASTMDKPVLMTASKCKRSAGSPVASPRSTVSELSPSAASDLHHAYTQNLSSGGIVQKLSDNTADNPNLMLDATNELSAIDLLKQSAREVRLAETFHSDEFPELTRAEWGKENHGLRNEQNRRGDQYVEGFDSRTHHLSAEFPQRSPARIAYELFEIETALARMSKSQWSPAECPTPDAKKPTPISPHNPVMAPPYFPTVIPFSLNKPDRFAKYKTDTLFQVFYCSAGSYKQLLAAKELKKRGWRYHTQCVTWFQRLGEPTCQTDMFESGDFVYFDFAITHFNGKAEGWCRRVKKNFKFEYKYLEDEIE